MGPLNQFTFCRLCLCTSASLSDLFEEGNSLGYLVKETIEDLLQFKVMRVNGCPWLTCENCREKLNDFRLFKSSCIESKLAFENRFPQQNLQIFLMPEKINISANSSQPANAVLLMPISHLSALANNTLQLRPPSLCKPLTPNYNPISMNGNSLNVYEQRTEENKVLRTEPCKIDDNLLVPKLEPVEFQPSVDSIEIVDDKNEVMLGSNQLHVDDVQMGIEETDVKDFMTPEGCVESSVGSEGDGSAMVDAGNIECQSNLLINHANADLRKTESTSIRTENFPVQEQHSLSKEQRNVNGDCPYPPSSVSPVDSFSHGDLTSASTITPVNERCEGDLQSRVDGKVLMKSACNQSSNLEQICELPVYRFEESLSKCLSNPPRNVQGLLHSECNQNNPQLPVNQEHQHTEITKVPKSLQNDNSGVKRYECFMCSKKFKKYENLASHKLSHAGDPKPYKCLMCPRVYSCRKNQMRHRKSHYNVPQRFECEVCKAGFRFRHYLQRHLKSHTVKNSYPCKICGVVLKSSQLRARHVAKHDGPKFPCTYCDKLFFLKYELNNHMLLHNNKKSFQCNICGKGFNKRQYLRCHRQLHDEEKRHTCQECGAKFAQYASLWQHRKWHQGNKKFVCDVCGKGFVLNCQLRQHKKGHTKVPKRKGGKSKAKTVERTNGSDDTSVTNEADGQKVIL